MPYSPRSRAERVIAAGRVTLAASSLLAIWLDPSEPGKYAGIAYALLSAYVAYALLVALVVFRVEIPAPALGSVTHGFDLAAFTLFMYFTEGPTSPFFVYFVFSITCATLRWQWRGTLWTALAALTLFVGLGVYAAEVLGDPAFQLNRFVIRSGYLAVVAGLLAYLGAYEQRLQGEMSNLAALPLAVPRELAAVVAESLQHAARVLGAPRVAMAWVEPEEPGLRLASWSGGQFHLTREPPGALEPLVPAPLADSDFLVRDPGAAAPPVVHFSRDGPQAWRGVPLHPDLVARLGAGTVLTLRVRSESLDGRLFALDKRGPTSDDLVLGRIVARQVAVRLDHFHLARRLQHAAAADERIRLARDLHDGLLQSLAGAALQLRAADRLLDETPAAARERLAEVQRLMVAELRDLRALIRQLKPTRVRGSEIPLDQRLEELRDRIERHWGLRVDFKGAQAATAIAEPLADEIYWLVHEALINAGRHAEATLARVELAVEEGHVRMSVGDDGRGFPFRGRYDLPALTRMRQGPVTLRERVGALGGSLVLESTENGAQLEITVPLTPG